MSIQDFIVIRGTAPALVGPSRPGIEAPGSQSSMSEDDSQDLATQLARLRQEHRDLDAAIDALHGAPGADLLQVQRLKKRKLQLRDRIIQFEDLITPDIIA